MDQIQTKNNQILQYEDEINLKNGQIRKIKLELEESKFRYQESVDQNFTKIESLINKLAREKQKRIKYKEKIKIMKE